MTEQTETMIADTEYMHSVALDLNRTNVLSNDPPHQFQNLYIPPKLLLNSNTAKSPSPIQSVSLTHCF